MNTTPENYVEQAIRTEAPITPELVSRMVGHARAIHATFGLITEVGELTDGFKRAIFYGKPLDITNVKEELGDFFWYVAILMDVFGYSFEDIMKANIQKLFARYPEKFVDVQALNRDLGVEREILESTESFVAGTGLMGHTSPGQIVTKENYRQLPAGSVVRMTGENAGVLIHLHDDLWYRYQGNGRGFETWTYDMADRFESYLPGVLCHIPHQPKSTTQVASKRNDVGFNEYREYLIEIEGEEGKDIDLDELLRKTALAPFIDSDDVDFAFTRLMQRLNLNRIDAHVGDRVYVIKNVDKILFEDDDTAGQHFKDLQKSSNSKNYETLYKRQGQVSTADDETTSREEIPLKTRDQEQDLLFLRKVEMVPAAGRRMAVSVNQRPATFSQLDAISMIINTSPAIGKILNRLVEELEKSENPNEKGPGPHPEV